MTTRKPVTFTGILLRILQAGETLLLNASATGGASLNAPHGAAPTSPVDGDFWSTTAGFFGRVDGATVGPFGVGGGSGGWLPMVDGSEPPIFITDGAGKLITVAYSP